MSIAVVCPGCDADYSVPENLSGKTIRCKKCGETVAVKAAKAARVHVPADDEDDRPRKAAPRRRFEEDDDDRPQRRPEKKGLSPLLIGGIAAVLLAASAGGAYLVFKPDSGENKQPVANNENGNGNVEKKPDEKKPEEKKPDEKQPDEKAPVEKKPDEAKPDEKKPDEKKPDEKKPTAPPKKTAEKPGRDLGPGVATEPGGYQYKMSWEEYIAGTMKPMVLEKVKRAAVFIKCENDGGAGTGSGWFGIEPGIVFTNAHVIDMLAPNSPPPKRLTAWINPGTNDERQIPHANIKILAVDREIDLACLQIVNEKDLPAPLKVRLSGECMEGLGLSTIGFPLGYTTGQAFGMKSQDKAPEVSVRMTRISSFRRTDFGVLRRVQIEGGVSPGNSGGAIVDAEGSVCAVVVEGMTRDMSVAAGVPTEYALGILAGRIGEVEYGMPYKMNGKVHIPVKAYCLDPFERLKKVGISAWTGNFSKKYRKPGTAKPPSEPGDANQIDVVLKYDSKEKIARGILEMPSLESNAVYWAQPFYENSLFNRDNLVGNVIDTRGPPADRIPAVLAYKPRIGASRVVTMRNTYDLSEDEEGQAEAKGRRVLRHFGVRLKETTREPVSSDPIQAARLQLQFDEMEMPKVIVGQGLMEQDLLPKDLLRQLNTFVKQTNGSMSVNKFGEIYKWTINPLNIQIPQIRALVTVVSQESFEAMEYCSIQMPDPQGEGKAEIQPGKSWTFKREDKFQIQDQLLAPRPQQPQPGVAAAPAPTPPAPRVYRFTDEITCTYVGVRERGGTREAVIEVEGKSVRVPGGKQEVKGTIKGIVLVELDTGVVLDATLEREFEVDTSSKGIKKSASGLYRYKIIRSKSD